MQIYWFTGLPCAGKTTLAREIADRIGAHVLDGDELRDILQNTDFSKEGRERNMHQVAWIAKQLSYYTPVIVSLVSPLSTIRTNLIQWLGAHLIYIKCPVEICQRRDVKGMWAEAASGRIPQFTGLSDVYEEPTDADLVLETDRLEISECVQQFLNKYQSKPKGLLIGRWQPFHQGHQWLMDQVVAKGYEPIIGIRNTRIEDKNPYSVQERIVKITSQNPNVQTVVVPDLAGVFYGRGVGYKVEQLHPPEEIGQISATDIRKKMEDR